MTQTKENIASEIVSIESLELGITDFRQQGVDTNNADIKKEAKMVNNGTNQTPEQKSANCGSIDESERAFGETERAIAEFMEREGKNVKALVEKTDGGRNPDAEVDGKRTEFKSLDAGATSATVKNQINNSIRRGGQARDIIIDARVSGLIEAEAERGLQRAKNITRGKIDSVRIIGDSYDITFTEFQ